MSLLLLPFPSEFSDYVDCARVRISGGAPQPALYQPVLLPDSDAAPKGSCLATRNSSTQCLNDRCPGRAVSVMVPAEFVGGARPLPIPGSLYGDAPATASAPTQMSTPAPPSQTASPPPRPTAPIAPADGALASLDVIRVADQSRVGSLLLTGDGRVAAGVAKVDFSVGGVIMEAVSTGWVAWVQFRIDGVVARLE